MKKIQYIIHAEFELPGIIETWAKQNQFKEAFCKPFAGEKTPHVDDFDLLIVMGGPQSPLEIDKDPYLKNEIALIKEALKKKKPVLGFCLGAQLIGEALGAKTERSPFKEVGVFPIRLTEEGCLDPIFAGLPSQFSVTHWHNDMPGLTKDSRILAASEGCPRQIVRYTSFAYGFQCHPEITKHSAETMITHCPDDLKPGKFVQPAAAFLSQNFASINSNMIKILDNLLASQFLQKSPKSS